MLIWNQKKHPTDYVSLMNYESKEDYHSYCYRYIYYVVIEIQKLNMW